MLRFIAALLYLCHGTRPLFDIPGGLVIIGIPVLQTAAIIELVTGEIETAAAEGFFRAVALQDWTPGPGHSSA